MNSRPSHLRSRPDRRGSIMIVSMLILFALAGMTIALCRAARVEAMASANHVARAQAASVERGAEQYVIALLSQQRDTVMQLEESYFAAVPVGEAGYFWVVRPEYPNTEGQLMPAFGLVDEQSKVDLNSVTADRMLAFSTVSQELALAIVDWRDADSTISNSNGAGGAEDEYYATLPNPYRAKNGLFETVEELLLVRGAYPELLWGERVAPSATNANESRTNTRTIGGAGGGGNNRGGPSIATGSRFGDTVGSFGLFDFVTVYSKEQGAASTTSGTAGGQAGGGGGGATTGAGGNTTGNATSSVVNINNAQNRQALQTLLVNEFGQERATAIMGGIGGNTRFTDAFDFANRVQLTKEELDLIFDNLTASDQPQRRGRINVNTATREALLSLPRMTEETVQQLLAARPVLGPTETPGIGWVVEALKENAVGLGEFVTNKSFQFSADIVAVSANGRAYRRVRVVFDAVEDGAVPKVVYRRDITERGCPLDEQVIADLKAGVAPTGGGVGAGGAGRIGSNRSAAPGGGGTGGGRTTR